MLLVRRGEGFAGAGEAFSGAGDGLPGTAAAGAASVAAELSISAIVQFLARWAVLAHRSDCGAASSESEGLGSC